MNSSNPLHGKSVLLVYSHCDDEIVCGWPVFQDSGIRKSLLIVSSDLKNKQRNWCAHRRYVTLDLCKSLGVPARVLDYDSDFYRLDHRTGRLKEFENRVLKEIDQFKFDYVMTHNPYGEYGHLDHRFLFDLLFRTARWPLLTSDIVMPSDWSDALPQSNAFRGAYFGDPMETMSINKPFYRRVQRFYETRGAWTWSTEPPETATIFYLQR